MCGIYGMRFWIGFSDQNYNGDVHMEHNENSKYTNWEKLEKNNAGDEDCAVLMAPSISYEWKNSNCQYLMSVFEMDTNI